MKKSILFVNPDYHCSFFYRDALRKRGWISDILVHESYPKKLLYSIDDIKYMLKEPLRILRPIYRMIDIIQIICKYKYIFIYSGCEVRPVFATFFRNIFGDDFCIDLFLFKLFKKKLIYLPSGCLNIDLQENISRYDNGAICSNCGWSGDACNDKINKLNFNILDKYFDLFVAMYPDILSKQYFMTIFKYKSLDLNLWSPDIRIPQRFKLKETNKLRILHSFYNAGRENNGKNIKGSPYIVKAIKRLISEGYEVEYFYVTDVESKNMRFYQAQADIMVEQLIYGWWGSTGAETMALGKPVICYLREDAKERFYEYFPDERLPIIEANINNIYDVLKKTVEDKDYREQKAKESREFAESYFDINKNVLEFEQMLMEIK